MSDLEESHHSSAGENDDSREHEQVPEIHVELTEERLRLNRGTESSMSLSTVNNDDSQSVVSGVSASRSQATAVSSAGKPSVAGKKSSGKLLAPKSSQGQLRRNLLDPGSTSGSRPRAGSKVGSSVRKRRGDNASVAHDLGGEQDLSNIEGDVKPAPAGVMPIWLSQSTQSLFKCVIDEHVTRDFPLKILGRDEVLEDISLRGVVSDFDKIAAEVRASTEEDFLLVYDVKRTYGENFFVCLTSDARRLELERITTQDLLEAEDDPHANDLMKEVNIIVPRQTKWPSSVTTEEEIEASRVVENRPLVCVAVTRKRREFGAPVRFADRDAHDGLHESRSFKDPNYDLRRLELSKPIQSIPDQSDDSTQTSWNRPVHMGVQYLSLSFQDDESLSNVLNSESLSLFLKQVYGLINHYLEQNETVNIDKDDYKLLENEENGIGSNNDNNMKEYTSFADIYYCKDKYVACVDWQINQGRRGVVGVSVCEDLNFLSRVEESSKAHTSYLLIWSFLDPIHPQLVLESPYDVLCFKFNPYRQSVVAGGLINGQVIVWDIGQAQENIRKHGRNYASNNNGGNANEAEKGTAGSKAVPVVQPLFISSIELSHRRPVTDLQWLGEGRNVGSHGKTGVSTDGSINTFVTAAGDGQVLFWDTLRPRKDPKKFDLTWAPTHRVPLNRLDGTAAEISCAKLSLGGPAFGTKFFVATDEGDLVYADWNPTFDDKPKFIVSLHQGHYGNCRAVERSPFFPDVIATVGDWTFSLWKEGVSQPVFTSPPSSSYLTCAQWSPTRPGLIFCGNVSGKVEIWDLTDRSHEPSLVQTITSASVETMRFMPHPSTTLAKGGGAPGNTTTSSSAAAAAAAAAGKTSSSQHARQLIAIGDSLGTTHILSLPKSLARPLINEKYIIESFFDWEVKRVSYMEKRRSFRAEELAQMERDKAMNSNLDKEESDERNGLEMLEEEDEERSGEMDQKAAASKADELEIARADEQYRAMEASLKLELGITDEPINREENEENKEINYDDNQEEDVTDQDR